MEKRSGGQFAENYVKKLRQEVAEDYPEAPYLLGKRYYYGLGVRQNYRKAAQLFRQSAEEGMTAARLALGKCCYWGKGVRKNYANAAGLFGNVPCGGWPKANTGSANVIFTVHKL